MILILLGAPGIGKTTLLGLLSEALQCPCLEMSWMPEFRTIRGVHVSYEEDERIAVENLILIAENYVRHGHTTVLLSDFRMEVIPYLIAHLRGTKSLPIILSTEDEEELARRLNDRKHGYRDVQAALAANRDYRTMIIDGASHVDMTGKSPQEMVATILAIRGNEHAENNED